MAGLAKCYGRILPSIRRVCLKDDIFRTLSFKRQFQINACRCAIKLDMPALSPTMTKGNIVKWHKKEGDTISPGDVLCEIETDKAVIAMDTEEEGILAKIIAPDNTQDIAIGQLIAVMVEEGEDWKNVEVDSAPSPTPPGTSTPPPSSSTTSPATPKHDAGNKMGPSVKKLLEEYAIEASSVPVTHSSGSLLKGDVLQHIKSKNLSKIDQSATTSQAQSPAAPASTTTTTSSRPQSSSSGESYVDIPLTNMRRTIARRLTESKTTIPHGYSSITSNIDAVRELRTSLAENGVKVSMNDFVIKAAALALKRVPQVNGIWQQDGPHRMNSVDISVAVATPNGLITPIVKGASFLSMEQIGHTVKEMAGRAKEGKLKPEEYQGGSFSISNLGMFGISEFTAVINPPQMAIMAVGTGRKEPRLHGGHSEMMTVTLSYDSRGLDPLDVTQFLEEFRHVLEKPSVMLSGTGLDVEAEAFAI